MWASGDSGIYIGNLLVPERSTAETIIEHLFYTNIIATADYSQDSNKRSYIQNGHMVTEDGEHKVSFVIHNSRIDEMMKTVGQFMETTLFDLTFEKIATGNKGFVQWAGEQCITNEGAVKEPSEEAEVPDDFDTDTPTAKLREFKGYG